MGHQLPALEKLFDEWTQKHLKLLSMEEPYCLDHEPPYGGFVRDGVVNFDRWKKQKVRICFLLNEAGGYADLEKFPNGHDVANEWNAKGSFTKFMFKLAIWVQAINDAFIPPVTYVKKDIKPKKDDLIRSIAIVNVKKSDGQVKPDFNICNKFANADAEEIRKELEIIKANIIICCGNLQSLWGKRPTEETENPEDAKKWVFYKDELVRVSKFAYAWDKKLVLSMWTPAQFYGHLSSNTICYYAVREIVRAALKALNSPRPAPKPADSNTAKVPASTPATDKPAPKVETPAEVKPAEPTPQAETPAEVKPTEPVPQAETPAEVKPAEPTPEPSEKTPAPVKVRRTRTKAVTTDETAAEDAAKPARKTPVRRTRKKAEDVQPELTPAEPSTD